MIHKKAFVLLVVLFLFVNIFFSAMVGAESGKSSQGIFSKIVDFFKNVFNKGGISGNVVNGGKCTSDSMCESGNCKAGVCCLSGKACCSEDYDCDGAKCDLSLFYCLPKTPNGQSCSLNSNCLSNNCYNGVCCQDGKICCTANSQCSSGFTCNSLYNYCVESPVTKKTNGQSCSSNSDCESGNCGNGVCCSSGKICCKTNSECGLGARCGSTEYYCIQTKMPGAACSSNLDCMTEYCNNGICCASGKTCCTANSQCPSGQICGAYKYCVQTATKSNGEYCDSNSQCQSGNCKNYVCCEAGKTCCNFDATCSSLGSDYKCSSSYYCAQTASTPATYSNGHACYSNSECSSGNCKNNICCASAKTCCAFNSECSSLGDNYECSSSSFYCILKQTPVIPETTEKLLEGESTLDLGLGAYGTRTWDININTFIKVGIGIYTSNDLTPNKYGGWKAYVKINGQKIWENKANNLVYDYAQGKEVTESSYKDQYFDITNYVKMGKNTIEYYHYTDGKHGPKVTVRGGEVTLYKTETDANAKKTNEQNNSLYESEPEKTEEKSCVSDSECSTRWCNNGYCCEKGNICCKTNSDCSRIKPVLYTGKGEAYRCNSNRQCSIPEGVKYGICDVTLSRCILDKSAAVSSATASQQLKKDLQKISGIVISLNPDNDESREVKRLIEEEIYPAIVNIFDRNSKGVFTGPRMINKSIKLVMSDKETIAMWDESSSTMTIPYSKKYETIANFPAKVLQANGIAHELVHYHLNGFAVREGGNYKKAPLWFREGFAEYGAHIYLKEYTSLGEIANTVSQVREETFSDYLLDKKNNYKETVKDNALNKVSWNTDSDWQNIPFKEHVYYGAAFSFINYFLQKDTFKEGESMMDIAKYMFIMGSKGKFKFYVHVDETKGPLNEKSVKEIWFDSIEKRYPGGIISKLDNKPSFFKRILSWFRRE